MDVYDYRTYNLEPYMVYYKMIKKFMNYLFKQDKKLMNDSIILFSSIFILNVLGYVFHFFVGRTLGPADYGIFGAILSLIYLITIPMNTLQPSITNFDSRFKARGETDKVKYLLRRSLRKSLILAVIATTVFLMISPFIADFFNTDNIDPFLYVGLFLFFALLLPITRGVSQGLQDFKNLGWNYITEGIVKLLFGAILVYVIALNGSVVAFGLSYMIPFFISLFVLKDYLKGGEKFDTKEIYKYSLPVLVMLTSLTAFYSIDVILAKHFFDAVQAGYYAAISLLAGKIVFFGSISISLVMFPKASESFALKKESKSVLHKSILLVTIFGATITAFYALFPKFSVRLLFGEQYFSIAPWLWVFSALMTMFSVSYLLAFYNISAHKYNFIWVLVFFNIVQIGLMYLFHDSIAHMIFIMMGIMIAMLLSLVAFTYKKNEIK